MKIIVGLGNPGNEYTATKHNVGFMLVDAIASEINTSSWHEKFNALISDAFIDGEKILLVKPQTYMNLSGEAIGPIIDYYKLSVDDIIVAHDDMDLAVGYIRLRPKGSGGGHHGIESIIQHLGGDENFARIRIGVGRPPNNWTVNHHVLSPFNDEDAAKIKETIKNLVPAALCFVKEGINQAMNKFNPKRVKKVKSVEVVDEQADNSTVC